MSSFFIGDGADGGFAVQWDVHDGLSDSTEYKEWSRVLDDLADWAREVRYITENPDRWEQLRRLPGTQAVAEGQGSSNSPFTQQERAAIAARIEEVKQQARENPELSAEQVRGIEQKLDDLVEASERVGKRDWLTMLYGASQSEHVIQPTETRPGARSWPWWHRAG